MTVKKIIKSKKTKKSVFVGPALKFKRYHKGCIRPITYSRSKSGLKLLDYGLKASEPGRLNPKQLETIRRIISRRVHHKKDKYVIHPKSIWPLTKKSKGVRMGKGKGAIAYYTSPISGGSMLYQIESKFGPEKVSAILKKVAKKLPTNTRLIIKSSYQQEVSKLKKNLCIYWTSPHKT